MPPAAAGLHCRRAELQHGLGLARGERVHWTKLSVFFVLAPEFFGVPVLNRHLFCASRLSFCSLHPPLHPPLHVRGGLARLVDGRLCARRQRQRLQQK